MAAIVIRPALPAEHAALGELTVAAYRSAPGGPATSPAYDAALRDVAGRARDAVVLVAVDADGGLLGGVTHVPGPGSLAQFEEGDAGIRMLAVSPAARRRGVGRRLVEACIARARADGRSRIVLHTGASMAAAQTLYGSLGFVRTPGLDGLVANSSLMAYTLDLDAGLPE